MLQASTIQTEAFHFFAVLGVAEGGPRMSEHHTILGNKVHVYRRPNSSSWQ